MSAFLSSLIHDSFQKDSASVGYIYLKESMLTQSVGLPDWYGGNCMLAINTILFVALVSCGLFWKFRDQISSEACSFEDPMYGVPSEWEDCAIQLPNNGTHYKSTSEDVFQAPKDKSELSLQAFDDPNQLEQTSYRIASFKFENQAYGPLDSESEYSGDEIGTLADKDEYSGDDDGGLFEVSSRDPYSNQEMRDLGWLDHTMAPKSDTPLEQTPGIGITSDFPSGRDVYIKASASPRTQLRPSSVSKYNENQTRLLQLDMQLAGGLISADEYVGQMLAIQSVPSAIDKENDKVSATSIVSESKTPKMLSAQATGVFSSSTVAESALVFPAYDVLADDMYIEDNDIPGALPALLPPLEERLESPGVNLVSSFPNSTITLLCFSDDPRWSGLFLAIYEGKHTTESSLSE
jgi:hypothetical protein